MSLLHVAKGLALPSEAVTETFGILAVRGAGKSNTAAVMAEEMFKAKLPFVVIDPVRAWWGLRSSRDGKGPGLPIPIFGGRRGDVPLERGGGTLMADLVADERLSCVLDVSEFESEGAKKQFLLDFATRLYRKNEAPLHLFLEEADDYCPQRPMREEAQLLRAWENIVRRGRNRGLGVTLITQRSAAINKNVLTQVQTLIAMRTTGPQDRAAIEEWLKYNNQERAILASLPGLADGEAWVWSPHFLEKTVRVQFRLRETFDSGATPKASSAGRPVATLADVDLAAIRGRMAATIEKSKQEDPKELKRQLAAVSAKVLQLQLELTSIKKEPAGPTLKANQVKKLEATVCRAEKLTANTLAALTDMVRAIPILVPATPARPSIVTPLRSVRPVVSHGVGDKSLGGPERKILTALAQHGPRSITALALLTGYASTGGAFRNPLSALRSKGYADGRGTVTITESGLAALGHWTPLPTGQGLIEWWMGHLPGPERKLLRAVVEKYPGSITVVDLASATDYAFLGGAFRNPLSRLRTLSLISGRGELTAAKELFSD